MVTLHLPISKSIANRLLLLQSIHGDPLMRVSADMPDDVRVLHDALEALQLYDGGALTLDLKNCGTALRFLEVHLAHCFPDAPILLTGDARLMERKGQPTTQTLSARILHGEEIAVAPNESPYITMSRRMRKDYPLFASDHAIEADWSAAAFWYEYIAIHGGKVLLEGLVSDSLQGDRIVADIYAQHFGVQTCFTPQGAVIAHQSSYTHAASVAIDFERTPDLYPAIALTCERLGIDLQATGTERLRYKESDRLEAVRLHEVRHDHRMAMALMAADIPVPIDKQACIAKSYPDFAAQHITPIRGVNDDHKGKKHALSKLIHAATATYVWLHDDDVLWPPMTQKACIMDGDLIILPLKMESARECPSLLEQLQIAEYAAIQQITIRSAQQGQAVLCSGANMIVRREAWIECEPDLHPEIPSGDDMFLLESAKRRGMDIRVIDDPDYTAIVRPVVQWRAFFRQRMRWAGKAPHYTDRDILRYGAFIATINMLQLLCPLILLVKFPIEYRLIRKRTKTHWSIALLLEILYPIYMLVCLIGGLIRKKW